MHPLHLQVDGLSFTSFFLQQGKPILTKSFLVKERSTLLFSFFSVCCKSCLIGNDLCCSFYSSLSFLNFVSFHVVGFFLQHSEVDISLEVWN